MEEQVERQRINVFISGEAYVMLMELAGGRRKLGSTIDELIKRAYEEQRMATSLKALTGIDHHIDEIRDALGKYEKVFGP